MKFQYLSDLHLEFPSNKKWVKKNIRPIGEYLLIAGDTGYLTSSRKNHIYENYCDDFHKYCSDNWKQTILIPGNHEYYGKYPIVKNDYCASTINNKIYSNVTLLNNDMIDIEGDDYDVRIFGATLWSYIKPKEFSEVWSCMNDYRMCEYKKDEKLNPGHTIFEYLKTYRELQSLKYRSQFKYHYKNPSNKNDDIEIIKKPLKTIIMTHHGCHLNCIAECYRSSNINSAYTSDLSNLIDEIKPDAWVYGHTHQTKTFEHNGVKIVENSLGYVDYDDISHFDKTAVLEI